VTPNAAEETVHRGVRWRRDAAGALSFFDTDGERWVRWAPGVDAPPVPPGWGSAGGRVQRPPFLSKWRLVPLVLVVGAVVVAVIQAERPAGNQTSREASASAALLGKCLAQKGTVAGRPAYGSSAVACSSTQASVRVVRVVGTTPGSPLCPAGTTGFELGVFAGVRYPHVVCVAPLHPGR
jgi:hypothetical protein